MKLSKYLISELGAIIIGDESRTFPYLGGVKIFDLYNAFCDKKDIYPDDLTIYDSKLGEERKRSRKQYSIDRLSELSDLNIAEKVLHRVIQKGHFIKDGMQSQHEQAINNVNEIIKVDGLKIEKNDKDLYVIVGGEVMDDPILVEIHFKDIKNQIISKIREAKVIIWIAMAWFTDDDIMREVLIKQKQGLDVKIVVFDEKVNIDYGILKQERKIHYNQIYKVSYEDNRKKMHNKFCIIDMKTVLHGTFNYSLNANKNDETFEILTEYNKAVEFSMEFLRLLKTAQNA